MSVVPGGANPKPDGVLDGNLNWLREVDEEYVRKQAAAGVKTAAEKAQKGFVAGILDPLRQIFAGLAPDGWGEVAQAWQDGQTALTDRLDLLSPLLDYGTAYMETVGGFLEFNQNYGTMPFNKQLGPMRGCELIDDGGIRLLEPGLWDIRAQLTFENNALNVGSGQVDWRVVVHGPDGSEYSRQRGIAWNVHTVTGTIVSSVVVPESGYTVQVEVSWIHGSRRLPGGPEFNRLTVQHISDRTDVGGTGAEESPTIDTSVDRLDPAQPEEGSE